MKRNDFLKITGGLALGSLATNNIFASFVMEEEAKKIKKFGLQLYTLRDVLPKDPKGILQQVASFGYKQIESYEGAQGMFWGMSNTDFKKYMDDLGMTIISSHCDTTKNFEKKVTDAAAIGMKYLIYPWEGMGKTIDDYKKFAEDFNKKGEICKKSGIRFAFHNHDYTFRTLEGQFAQDVLLDNTDPSLVDFELDIYWVVAAGQDPEAWFKKSPNRYRLCHVKDRTKNVVADNGKNSIELGTGIIDWKKILNTARKYGMEYFIVEQEAYPNGTSLEAIKVNAAYMKKLKI